MPTLVRRHNEVEIQIIPVSVCVLLIASWYCLTLQQNALFIFNAQHDCQHAKCTASGQRHQKQERQESGVMESFIEHNAVDCFVINTHTLHNAHLIRNTLPRELTRPLALFSDRRAKHHELAAKLRTTKDEQRLAAKKKQDEKKVADEFAAAESGVSGSKPRKRKAGAVN